MDAEFLYLNMLPFSEDLRQYTFSSLAPDKARKAYVPSEEQVKAMDDFIDSLDLMKAASDDQGNKMEALKVLSLTLISQQYSPSTRTILCSNSFIKQ